MLTCFLVLSEVPFLSVPDVSVDGMDMLHELLHRRNRKITQDQANYVARKVAVEPSALYIRLAVRVVACWTSEYQCDDSSLSGGVRALLNQTFDQVAVDYGQELTASAIGFISLSVQGVSDDEMVDLLSLDDDVLKNLSVCLNDSRVPTRTS